MSIYDEPKIPKGYLDKVTVVCPYCYALKKNVWFGEAIRCDNTECDQIFRVSQEIISLCVKVKGIEVPYENWDECPNNHNQPYVE
jgi:hypothetical protein